MKKILINILALTALFSFQASAHLIYIGYDDLGDGTVDFYGQTYHSVTQSPGDGIQFTNANDGNDIYQAFWSEVLGNLSVTDMAPTLTQGWDMSTSSQHNDSNDFQWHVAKGVSLTNGIFNLSSISANAVDAPWPYNGGFPQVNITGITNSIPEPSTLAIFALGVMGLVSRKIRK